MEVFEKDDLIAIDLSSDAELRQRVQSGDLKVVFPGASYAVLLLFASFDIKTYITVLADGAQVCAAPRGLH